MSAIGGYFELELRQGSHYHPDAIKLNTARNSFEYILRSRNCQKVYIPLYACEVLLEPLVKLGIPYQFYSINKQFEPEEKIELQSEELFLYTNYFGLKQNCVEELASIYKDQLIVDNAQAFYAPPLSGINTFYSPRKFFGIPDGGYLFSAGGEASKFQRDFSLNRISHLLKRIELSAEEGFEDFKRNDKSLANQPILVMSRVTDMLLRSIDYETAKHKRIQNYKLLESALGSRNKLKLKLTDNSVPMVYPYWTEEKGMRNRLISQRIYVATYWPNVFHWSKEGMLEYCLAENLIPLPIDQRYSTAEMEKIARAIKHV